MTVTSDFDLHLYARKTGTTTYLGNCDKNYAIHSSETQAWLYVLICYKLVDYICQYKLVLVHEVPSVDLSILLWVI